MKGSDEIGFDPVGRAVERAEADGSSVGGRVVELVEGAEAQTVRLPVPVEPVEVAEVVARPTPSPVVAAQGELAWVFYLAAERAPGFGCGLVAIPSPRCRRTRP